MQKAKRIINILGEVLKKYYKHILLLFVFIILFTALNILSYVIYNKYSGVASVEQAGYLKNSLEGDLENGECNVAGINLHGQLITYMPQKEPIDLVDFVSSDYISYYIKAAEDDENIKAIVLEVDSSGGSPVAGEEIAQLLQQSTKPTIALIRQAGLSAAYWAATGADTIFASKNSDIGSIGVTYSYLENVSKNQKDGLTYVPLYSGRYKEMGSPDRVLTDEERNLIMRDLKIIHQNFIKDVARNRNLSVEKVSLIADGSSVLGEQAKNLGLIDRIGGLIDVEQYLEGALGEKAEICWE